MTLIQAAERSLMATGAMLWGGASYNNGIVPYKNYILGEAYTRDGEPAKVESVVKVDEKMKARGVLAALYPLPAWETVPPGDVFRVFERGGRNIVTQFPEIGLPNALGQLQRLEEPGRPDIRQSNRGPGTGLRVVDPGAQHPQDPAQRSVHLVPRHQRPARRLPHLGLRRAATWSTPTTATRATRGPMPPTGITAPPRPRTRRSRATSRATRSGTTSPAPSRRASA